MVRLGPSRSLKVVGWLLVFGGASAVLNGLVASGQNYAIDLNIIGLFLGIGLLRRRAWALKWSELWVVLSIFVGSPLAIMLLLGIKTEPFTAAVLGYPLGQMNRSVFTIGILTMIALSVWEYRVLVREDVRALARTT